MRINRLYKKTCAYENFLIPLLKALEVLEYTYPSISSKQKGKTG
jgi:hypothetical protein